MSAFTRIAREPIHERGTITSPDLVVIADASLIADPSARVSDGIAGATIVFVNSPLSAEQVRNEMTLPGRLTTLDLTERALQQFGRGGAISALLGAVAGRLIGLKKDSIRRAIEEELSDLGLAVPVIEQNQVLALRCYDDVPLVALTRAKKSRIEAAALCEPKYDPPTRGTARITAGPNSHIRSMSGWRTFRPVLRPDLCNGCWLCFASCPEGAITVKPDGMPAIYYPHCKGCLDCVEVCPTDALTVEREPEAARKNAG